MGSTPTESSQLLVSVSLMRRLGAAGTIIDMGYIARQPTPSRSGREAQHDLPPLCRSSAAFADLRNTARRVPSRSERAATQLRKQPIIAAAVGRRDDGLCVSRA
ncbi:hypothetical protein AcV5_005169 [Taiwanofungus camphoratus]|nr:hypothetical protein AcV5_005169 [Antrodia cinnamomea]